MIGVLLAMTLSRYDYSFVGWLLGGAIMGVGIMYAYVAPQKRSVLKWMYVLTVPGVVSGIIYNLFD